MSTDTPRTDALAGSDFVPDGVWIKHARTLERENTQLRAEVARLRLELRNGTETGEPCAEVVRLTAEVARLRACVRDFINHCANGTFYAGPVDTGRRLLGDSVDENGMTVAGEVAQTRAAGEDGR